MAEEIHRLMDGKVRIYRRTGSSHWHCAAHLHGFNHRTSTREENLSAAMAFAREWYMARYLESKQHQRVEHAPLNGTVQLSPVGTDPRPVAPVSRQPAAKVPRRTPPGPTFSQACEAFLTEYELMTKGERNPHYVKNKRTHVDLHLVQFFGADRPVVEISPALIQDYRLHRQTSRKTAGTDDVRRPARTTLHSEIVTLRQVLKTANRRGWIPALPDMRDPYQQSGKVTHRGWFSPDEYKQLYKASRERAKNPKNERWRDECEQLHDYVLFMVNSGLRPDEAARLQMRDVTIVDDEATGQRLLQIEVRGKRGYGPCKTMPGAVLPFERVVARKKPEPTDILFGKQVSRFFNAFLTEIGLKEDREGNDRTAYSLRHTYISMRLLERADIYNLAKNCRTSVEMIQKFYAAHIAELIDTASINVRQPKRRRAAGATAKASTRAASSATKQKRPAAAHQSASRRQSAVDKTPASQRDPA